MYYVCINRGHSSKLREISFMRLTIEKLYFFNKINLYVLEQCAFMAIISFYGRKIIFGHFLRCNWTCLLSKVFVSFFGGIWYKNGLFGATTHHYIDFTALNAGKKKERKSHFWTQLYHHARNGRLFPASYMCPKLEAYN